LFFTLNLVTRRNVEGGVFCRDLYQAEYNYLPSQLRLKATVVALGEAELARVNQALN